MTESLGGKTLHDELRNKNSFK
ncbi:hypothetical protein FOXB_12417 [Fusarium oxysporum f. sp. conglutinans Fo5176]|uniref:Uncharacterized protein n=1 Tax=Fusarium oxysporum (strain Fo5176) TaxID=660025 RepID=F9G185_FUSOF|nr:hypothetical protein FOXB_12417 [Fusarium oxysporum f. sp. conglutinans Fo5176]